VSSLTGELDLASANLLHERLEQVESENPELLVLDPRRLGFMDSSGLREVIGAVRRGREEGRKVALVRAHGPIEDLLQSPMSRRYPRPWRIQRPSASRTKRTVPSRPPEGLTRAR
jgi:anti-anti-sigma factor